MNEKIAMGGLTGLIKNCVSPITEEMAESMRGIIAAGETGGMRRGVMAQWGDSNTYTQAYLSDWYESLNTGVYSHILAWIAGGASESLAKKGENYANYSGWRASDVISGMDGAINLLKPSWAHLMIGTNDVQDVSAEAFEANLCIIIDRAVARGVVPTLSTIIAYPDSPARLAIVLQFNGIIKKAASDYKVPYVDLYGLFTALYPDNWAGALMSDDRHMNYNGASGAMSSEAGIMNNGYLLRNLLTCELAELMRDTVFKQRRIG